MKEYIEAFKEQNKEQLATLLKLKELHRTVLIGGGDEWLKKTRQNYDLVFGDDQLMDFREALSKRKHELEEKLRKRFSEGLMDYYFDILLYGEFKEETKKIL